ncbi:hypothetical protein ACFYZJ_32130 [Streptomyces sp. NPDC001848]|uniref:hypothetical protein n=1 Tax=Streptomyces sp. NPDC001848 TaxID=3364618 RepID=UPI0036A2AE42
MRCASRTALSVVLAAACLAGCRSATPAQSHASPSGTAAGPAGTAAPGGASSIAVGPGPQPAYTVQKQPAPGSCHYRHENGEPLPDPTCTPGATSPAVTQATVKSTICRKSGYTKSIRPPVSITSREKRLNAASYGYNGRLADAEYDHLISLELGGDPNDERNLWVEPADPGHKTGSGINNKKDPVESKLHTAVCDGKVTLAAAQQAIAGDWTTALSKLGLS